MITRFDIYCLFWSWKRQGLWMHESAFVEGRGSYNNLTVTTPEHFNMVVGRKWLSHSIWEGDELTSSEVLIAEKLLGPYGYSYYRLLLAQVKDD